MSLPILFTVVAAGGLLALFLKHRNAVADNDSGGLDVGAKADPVATDAMTMATPPRSLANQSGSPPPLPVPMNGHNAMVATTMAEGVLVDSPNLTPAQQYRLHGRVVSTNQAGVAAISPASSRVAELARPVVT